MPASHCEVTAIWSVVDVAESDPDKARAEIERMCEQLLANTIIENYAFELEAA